LNVISVRTGQYTLGLPQAMGVDDEKVDEMVLMDILEKDSHSVE